MCVCGGLRGVCREGNCVSCACLYVCICVCVWCVRRGPCVYEVRLCVVCAGSRCVCSRREHTCVRVRVVCMCGHVSTVCSVCICVSVHVHLPGSSRVAPTRRISRRLSPELPRVVLSACSWWSREGWFKEDRRHRGSSPEQFTSKAPLDSEGRREAERALKLPGDTEGVGGHCWGLEQFLLTPSPVGFLLGPFQRGQGQPTGSQSSRRIWLGSRGEQLRYTQCLGGQLRKQHP